MAGNKFVLVGLEEALRVIQKLYRGQEVRTAIRRRLREAARPVTAMARSLAPEDEGTLSRSIKLRAGRRSRRSIGVVIGPPTSKTALGIPANAPGYFPTHLELGTRRHRQFSFLRAAMDATMENSKRVLAEGLGEDITRIALAA